MAKQIEEMEIRIESGRAIGAINDLSKAVRDMQDTIQTAKNTLIGLNGALGKLSEKEAGMQKDTSDFSINTAQSFNVL
ncbi:MAG: hypothetical protein ACLSAP_10805, partial [Oscillospiraceae bacterium]